MELFFRKYVSINSKITLFICDIITVFSIMLNNITLKLKLIKIKEKKKYDNQK